ncbi:hypothetical protein MJO29_006913 [Puccinia striiformis f. sp. tritici]|nr:hypothetical protein MJO29_006913 [Puccinia striiformis f. sp. tritici]
MAGYIENGLDGLMLNAYEKDELRRQGDLVIEGFRILGNNHWTTTRGPHDTIGCPHHPAEYLPDRLDCKKSANRFHWNIPSLLRQQITRHSESLDPFLLQSQPGPTLKLILEIQLEIDESLNQIKDVLQNNRPAGTIQTFGATKPETLFDFPGPHPTFEALTRRAKIPN